MKKSLIFASLLAVSSLMAVSCGTKSEKEENTVAEEMVETINTPAENPENAAIAQYIQENNITVEPNADGLYIVVKEQGNGPKVEMGKKVKMNYTGRLLNGKVFDSSVEKVAQEGGVYDKARKYEPLAYEVGKMGLIKGWENGVMGQNEGSKLLLIFPSTLGYGANEIPGLIPANSPLTFEIEIVEVK